jgi:histidyl-tRNA synthetase
VLRAIDKMDKFPVDEIKKLLGPGRWDGGEEGKGDFTKGAGLTDEQTKPIIAYALSQQFLPLEYAGNQKPEEGSGLLPFVHTDGTSAGSYRLSNEKTIQVLRDEFGGSDTARQGLDELSAIADLTRAAGYTEDQIRIDPSVVRGLEYYTGAVYEVELTLETKDEKGRPVRFGSVGGGGRYDGLVSRFRGEPVPATGFSIGVSRLQAALTLLGKIDTKQQPGPVVVTVFGGEVADYQAMVAKLRNAGIRAELYLGNPKHALGQQMKYADKRNSPLAIIQGSDERAAGKLQIKDLIAGAGLTEIKDREEYLAKQAEAQIEIAETDLVSAVQTLLAKHGVSWSA